MSAQEDEPGHDEHDDFDGEPAQELGPGEPETPNWVPLLGVALFVVGGIYFLSTMDDEGDSSPKDEPAATAQAKPTLPPPAATPARPAARPRPAAAPGASGKPALGLTKEKARELLEQAQERRRKREAAAPK